MKDIRGIVAKVGDQCAYTQAGISTLTIGKIAKITPKRVGFNLGERCSRLTFRSSDQFLIINNI